MSQIGLLSDFEEHVKKLKATGKKSKYLSIIDQMPMKMRKVKEQSLIDKYYSVVGDSRLYEKMIEDGIAFSERDYGRLYEIILEIDELIDNIQRFEDNHI